MEFAPGESPAFAIPVSPKNQADKVCRLRERLKDDMAALRKEFAVDVSRWGFAS
jgi:hypothetical protein